jgi:hypothetical protein
MITPNKKQKQEESIVRTWINTGSEITGASVGGYVGATTGFAAAGPVGASIASGLGVIVGKGLSALLNDFTKRTLSNREKARIGAAVYYASLKIQEYLDNGLNPRDDNFFGEEIDSRPDAETIFEGILQKSQREHEEKKARIYGNIFANIAFNCNISFDEANHVLQLVERLSYKQLCVLAFIGTRNQFSKIQLRTKSYSEESSKGKPSRKAISTFSEVYSMCSERLLKLSIPESPGDYLEPIDWTGITPNNLKLDDLGEVCFELMSLQDIPVEDILIAAEDLVSS